MSEQTDSHWLMRTLGIGNIAWGAAILTAGPPIWRSLDEQGPTEIDQLALRFLGARHAVTGAVQVFFPGRFQRLEIAVDLIHTATMVGLAAVDPPRRRPALVTAAVALGSGLTATAARARSSQESS